MTLRVRVAMAANCHKNLLKGVGVHLSSEFILMRNHVSLTCCLAQYIRVIVMSVRDCNVHVATEIE